MKFYNINKLNPDQKINIIIMPYGYGKKKALERHNRHKRIKQNGKYKFLANKI